LNSNIIRISFRHRDPITAADFANAIAQAFIDRQVALFGRPGAATFFQRQRERFADDFKRASSEPEAYSVATGTYAADDQQQLLLKRLNDLSLSLAVTRGSISKKTGSRRRSPSSCASWRPWPGRPTSRP